MVAPRIVVSPSGFKESLTPSAVAAAIAAGVRTGWPGAEVIELPVADGGEGFTETLIQATGGELNSVTVTGPIGQPVQAYVGILGGKGPRTAVIEMAAAAGLRLVPRDQRNPLTTTTYGVGELIAAAIGLDIDRLLIGCGDSGTNDGGAGMAQALGIRLLRADGSPIGRGGAALLDLDRIDMSNLDSRLDNVEIDVACNIHNVLCGDQGVARVFGPQKGASVEIVQTLEQALAHYAAVISRDLALAVHDLPGGGASGGLGAGLFALLGATLHPRYDVVMRYLDLDGVLATADLVITAEGGIDAQTPRGKVPVEVARRAKLRGLPVIAFAGTIGPNATVNFDYGIDAMVSPLDGPMTLDTAFERAAPMLTACAENVMRVIAIGWKLNHE